MGNYDDIINLQHPVSRKHPQMSMESRAAQFMPFSALTGYSAVIKKTEKAHQEEENIPQEDFFEAKEEENIPQE